jgi:hypothetical protein
VRGALVVIDEQAGMRTYTEGLALEELEAQRAELVPDRIEMRKRKRRRRGPTVTPVTCVAAVGFPCDLGPDSA